MSLSNDVSATYSCADRKNARQGITVHSHKDLSQYMTSSGHMTCVHAAAQLGCLNCLKWMVDHIGLDPNQADRLYGATPLHYAANIGHIKVIKYLMPKLVKVSSDADGATPLHDAAVQGHLTCVQELLKSALVNPEQVDNYGLTAAEWAEQAQEKKCAKLIREAISKKLATLPKKKRGTLSREKPTVQPISLSQHSDSTESQPDPLTSDTYALLEPTTDCGCITHPDLPPRLPETPRPSKQDHAIRHGSPVKSPTPKGKCNHQERSLPPPPESMLQSLHAASLAPALSVPPPPPPAFEPVPGDSCYYIHTLDTTAKGKPVSAVPPFNHMPTLPPSTVAIGTKTLHSPLTSPSPPQHSFSTFNKPNPPTRRQEHQYTDIPVHNKDAHYENALPVSMAAPHHPVSCSSGTNTDLGGGHTTQANGQATNKCTGAVSPPIPDWKQQLLQQKAKKQEEQLAEVSQTPDWKKLIQERKQAQKTPTKSEDNSKETEDGLAPWQSELKRAGKVLPVDLPE